MFRQVVSTFLCRFLGRYLTIVGGPLVLRVIRSGFRGGDLYQFGSAIRVRDPSREFRNVEGSKVSFAATRRFLASSGRSGLQGPRFSYAMNGALFACRTNAFLNRLAFLVVPRFFMRRVATSRLRRHVSGGLRALVTSGLSGIFFINVKTIYRYLLRWEFYNGLMSSDLLRLFWVVFRFFFPSLPNRRSPLRHQRWQSPQLPPKQCRRRGFPPSRWRSRGGPRGPLPSRPRE